MPIRPELRKFYGRTWRNEVRPRILKRADYCCEQCKKPNGRDVITASWRDANGHPFMVWCLPAALPQWFDMLGRIYNGELSAVATVRKIRGQVGVAHLDHDPANNTPHNLKALCNWCHLNYDKTKHKRTREARKDAARPLLVEMTA